MPKIAASLRKKIVENFSKALNIKSGGGV